MHILGMAKSSLTLKGAKAPKLELDFFKLAFAVAAFRAVGEQAIGYLQVLALPARDRALGWDACYEGMLIDGIPETELLRGYRSQHSESQ
jgi:hypothetical protein